MKKVSFLILLFLLNACANKQYVLKSVNGSLIEMDNRFDNQADPAMLSLVQTYKTKLDAKTSEVIGEADQALTKTGTQSVLANFTADAMREYAAGLWGPVDFAVINNGGLRATINQGPITIGDLYFIYSFENRLVLLELPGKAVKQLFGDFARTKPEGFSKGVRLTIKNKAVESLTIGGKPLNETATYRVATVDFLAEGNNGTKAFIQATRRTDSDIILRDVMIDYVKKLTAQNKKIHAIPDDRLEIKE